MKVIDNGGTVLLCAWHQQFFSAIRHFQKYRRFNPGIMISRSKDGAIVPFYVSAEKAWYFNSWDRFMLPKPFSKMVLQFGPVINLVPVGNDADFEMQRRQLEQTMAPALVGFGTGD